MDGPIPSCTFALKRDDGAPTANPDGMGRKCQVYTANPGRARAYGYSPGTCNDVVGCVGDGAFVSTSPPRPRGRDTQTRSASRIHGPEPGGRALRRPFCPPDWPARVSCCRTGGVACSGKQCPAGGFHAAAETRRDGTGKGVGNSLVPSYVPCSAWHSDGVA